MTHEWRVSERAHAVIACFSVLSYHRNVTNLAQSSGAVGRAGATLACLLAIIAMAACATLPSSPSEISLRVMSYNIAAGGGDLDRTTATIRTSAADIVALQEVDVHWSTRSGFTDQAAVLAERLGMQVRFAHIYALPGATAATPLREHGVALLSRYPIVAYTNHSITRLSTQAEGSPPAPMPGFLEATVDVRGTRVRVFNTHLDFRPDPAVRRQQVDETLAIIGHPSAPTLLFGDLNAPPGAPELQPIFKQLRDSWVVSADSGFTYSATAPVRRIDYVFSSSHFRVSAVAVFESLASDHRPVIIDLVVDPARK